METLATLDKDSVTSVSFSPDGSLLAAASPDARVTVVAATTGRTLHTFLHDEQPKCVRFSTSDNNVLATGSADGTLCLFDLDIGHIRDQCKYHTDAINHIVFSPSGRTIATASADKTINLVQCGDRQRLQRILCIRAHRAPAVCVSFASDGRRLATASRDGTCRIFDVVTGTQLCVISHASKVLSCTFSPSGTCIATTTTDGSVRILDTVTGSPIYDVPLPPTGRSPVLSAVFNCTGDAIAAGGDDGVWVFSLKLERVIGSCSTGRVASVRFSPDGSMLAIGGTDHTSRVVSVPEAHQSPPPLTGLHCILNLQDEAESSQDHSAASGKTCIHRQLQDFGMPPEAKTSLGTHSFALPFDDKLVADVVIGPRHLAVLLTDGRVCRLKFFLDEKAAQEQVNEAERIQAATSALERGRSLNKDRDLSLPSAAYGHRRHRYIPPGERLEIAGSSGGRRQLAVRAERSDISALWEERERQRAARASASGRGRGASGGHGGARGREVSAAGAASSRSSFLAAGARGQPAFSYHSAMGLEAALELRASASLGGLRQAPVATPPEAMIQAVQEMFGSIPRDVIIRALRTTGSVEATIDHLLTRNSSDGDNESESSPSPSASSRFDPGMASFARAVSGGPSGHGEPQPRRTSSTGEGSRRRAAAASSSASSHGAARVSKAFKVSEVEWLETEVKFRTISCMISGKISTHF